MTRTARQRLAAAVAGVLLLSGCNLDPQTATLPGGAGTGSGDYTITAEFASSDNLVANSEVQYNNVRVGTVLSVKLDRGTWHSRVRLGLDHTVPLPANVTAAIGQKSLLGAEYVQLDAPAKPVGRLGNSEFVPISRTSRYPATEEVLSAVSLLLNDGGLAQLKTITGEIDAALSGREGTARSVLNRLTVFVTRLDEQKQQIIGATESLNRLATQLADNRDTVARALTHITPAVTTLNRDRTRLTAALKSLDRLSVVATKALDDNRTGLATNLAQLRPTLTKLVEAGRALPDSLPIFVSFPFPITTLDKAVKGDYMNLFVTADLSLDSIQKNFLAQLPIIGQLPLQTITQDKNALTAPVDSGSPAPKATTQPTSPAAPTPSTPAPTSSPPCNLITQLLGGGC